MKSFIPRTRLALFSALAASLALAAQARADQYGDMKGKDLTGEFPLTAFSAIGSSFAEGNHLPELGWSDAQVEAFIDGIRAAFKGRPYLIDEGAKRVSAAMGEKMKEIQSRSGVRAMVATDQLAQYLKQASRRLSLEEADSGLCYAVQETGKGSRPGPDDSVVISIQALAADGQTPLPDLSAGHFQVKVSDLMPGLREGVQMLAVGSHGTFLVPPSLSFGKGEWPTGIPKGDPILFQVGLIDVLSPGGSK